MLAVEVAYTVTAAPPSVASGGVSDRVLEVAAMFGLGLDHARAVTVLPPTTVPLRPGTVVFVTGASGGGKSTLLRCLRAALAHRPDAPPVLDFADLPPAADAPLVDALAPAPLPDALAALAVAGLNDAFVMLRRPAELSDGQRYRFQLARLLLQLDSLPVPADHRPRAVLLADEFGATLDRTTAANIARNLRRFVTAAHLAAVLATTHDDLLEPLAPDVLIEQHLGGRLEIAMR
jgi:uncharacterized protein